MLFIPDKGDSFQKSYFREVVKKNGLFTVRLTVRGGRGSAPSALTISKCEKLGPIFPFIK